MGRRIIFALVCIAWCPLTGCTSNVEEFSEVVKADQAAITIPAVPAEENEFVSPYQWNDQKFDVAWWTCQVSSGRSAVLVFHGVEAAPSRGFCQSWMAQVFLAKGINVVAFHRPGYGKSTGEREFAGPQTVAAAQAVTSEARKQKHPISGVWGIQDGAIGAAFYAKTDTLLQWLILGNGIYDLELAHKSIQSPLLKQQLNALVAKEKDMAYESRSIAWDFSGLPHQLFLYHGQANTDVAPLQATQFRDSLVTQEHTVALNLIEGGTEALSETQQIQVMTLILAKIAAPAKK